MSRWGARGWWWLLVVSAGGVLAHFVSYPSHLAWIGVNRYGPWFLDLHAILAANDALALGRDIYRYNPLDHFGRPHVYPHAWLVLGRLGLTRADGAWLGFAMGAAFFVAAVAQLRPRRGREVVWALLVLCAPPVLLALERANNDLVVFVLLAGVVPCLGARRPWARYLAIGLIAVATALKTYPAVAALVLLAGSEPRELRWRVGAMTAVFAALAVDFVRDFAHYGGLVPHESGLMTFGAANLLSALGAGDRAGLWAVAAGAALVGWLWRANPLADWRIAPSSESAWWSFVLGAAVLTGCFFAGLNFGYRWIFSLWLLPLLWKLRSDRTTEARARRLAAVTGGLLLITLWLDGLVNAVLTARAKELGAETVTRWADGIFLIEQPVTWALFVCLLVFLVRFAREGLQTLLGRASVGR